MALVTEIDLPALDYLGPDLKGDRFHETMRGLRERHWLATTPIGFVVLEREAAAFFLRTKSATFPGMRIAELFEVPEGPLLEQMRRNILHVNGEAHGRLRNLVNPAFTPRAADRWRPAMRDFLERLWAPLEGRGRCEFVAEVAKPYPSLTIATVMGAPFEDAAKLHEWSNLIQRQFDPPSLMNERDAIERACAEFYEWAGALIERRRHTPGDDLISTLIAAEGEGDRLSDVECMNLVLNVLVGGVDTTQSQLAHAVRLLAAKPDQWRLLAERPELAPAAAVVPRSRWRSWQLRHDVLVTDEVLADQVGYYRRRAGEYDVTAYGEVAAARARISRLVVEMHPTGTVLEIACGTGLWTEALAGLADAVTAIDAAPEVVDIARERVTSANVTFEVADVFS